MTDKGFENQEDAKGTDPRILSDQRYIESIANGSLTIDDPTSTLISFLASKDWATRSIAIEALARAPRVDPVRSATAITTLAGDPEAMVRDQVATSLGRLGQRESEATLTNLLTDPEELVRADAAEALGYIGATEAVSALLTALHDEYAMVRNDAAYALGFLGRPEIVEELLTEHLDDFDNVKAQVSATIYRLGDRRGLDHLLTVIDGANQELLARQTTSIVDDLVNWHQPPTLRADKGRIIASLASLATRCPRVQTDAALLTDKLNLLR